MNENIEEKKKELFSEKVSAGSRTYFFDIKQAKDGTRYVVISETRQGNTKYDHTRIMIFEEHFNAFCEGFEKIEAFFGINRTRKPYSIETIRQTHSNAYEKWTREDDERLKKEFAQGMSIPELSKLFHRNQGAIRSRLNKLGMIRST